MGRRSSPFEPRRKILYVTTNDITRPARGGDRRSHQIERWLSRWNTLYSISYLRHSGDREANTDREYTVRYPDSRAMAPFDPRVFRRILRLRDTRDFEWVVASGLGSFLYGIVAMVVHDARLVVDLHNAEHVLSKQFDDPAHYLLAQTVGRLAVHLASIVVFTSENDRSHYSERVKAKSVVVANGFDSETFFPSKERDDGGGETEMLFFGNMEYPPNREAVQYIAHELAPQIRDAALDAEILVAGPACERITDVTDDSPTIRVLGLVDDIAERVRSSDLVVVPLKAGSGTRLKIIESLACGTPVVSTPKGAEGWPTEWENLTVVDEAEFSESVLREISDSPVPFEEDEYSRYLAFSWRKQIRTLDAEMSRRERQDQSGSEDRLAEASER